MTARSRRSTRLRPTWSPSCRGDPPSRGRCRPGRSSRRLRLRRADEAGLVRPDSLPARIPRHRRRARAELRPRSRASRGGDLPRVEVRRACALGLGRRRPDAAPPRHRERHRRPHGRLEIRCLGPRRSGDQRPLRLLLSPPPSDEVRGQASRARRLQRGAAERRRVAGRGAGDRLPGDEAVRRGGARARGRVPACISGRARGRVAAHQAPGGPRATMTSMPDLRVSGAYRPTGDQPSAISTIAEGFGAGERFDTLLGATGTGKTATMAWIMEQLQRPALVIAHNKTLAAQLCNEFREFFPDNAVEYFVSYYDYYQPEAYVPQADLYIEKDASQNDDIARLRLNATSALFTRRDVVVVASVSCIYGLGSPEEWRERVIILEVGEEHDRDLMLRKLIDSQYVRNDTMLGRGRFRVKGDVVEVQPANQETAYRISFFGDEVEQITHFDPLTGEVFAKLENLAIWPATEYVTSQPTIERAVDEIRHELEERLKELEAENKLLEAHRLRQRTEYDLEMMKELGFCNGIENYSRILEGRAPGTHPFTLLDYFPSDFVVFVDESHQTVPQIGGMYEGDRSRKQTLVDYGFRLPSALDNRPLRFDEFLQKVPQLMFVSATPGPFELRHSQVVAEQLIRPTFLVDPEVELRETRNQIDDLLNEIRRREEAGERVLVTTLTKKMSEDLTDYLLESGIKARYLHSEIDTLERIQIIRELRLGDYDVLVGVNLLREGLDLPEVSLVAILDADKEGFLRGKTALIQTIGRAARNIGGTVLMYADKETAAMRKAIEETDRRRAIQRTYNEEHGITPETIVKGISDITEFLMSDSKVPTKGRRRREKKVDMSQAELETTIVELEEEMLAAAEELRFEYAAKLRDEIRELRRELDAASA